MSDNDRLRTLAQACVQAAHDVEDTDTAAMLLESAHRFLSRTNPELAGLSTGDQDFQSPADVPRFRALTGIVRTRASISSDDGSDMLASRRGSAVTTRPS